MKLYNRSHFIADIPGYSFTVCMFGRNKRFWSIYKNTSEFIENPGGVRLVLPNRHNERKNNQKNNDQQNGQGNAHTRVIAEGVTTGTHDHDVDRMSER